MNRICGIRTKGDVYVNGVGFKESVEIFVRDSSGKDHVVDSSSLIVNVYGSCEAVQTMSGDVVVNGSVDTVKTMSGDVSAKGGVVHARTMSGDITL